MKLHLPKGLRRAVLACLGVVGGFTTTVGTGFITGGALALTLAVAATQSQASVADLTQVDLSANNTSGDGVFAYTMALDVGLLRTYLENGSPAVTHPLVQYNASGVNTGISTNFEASNDLITAGQITFIWGDSSRWNDVVISSHDVWIAYLKNVDWDSVAGAGLTYSFDQINGTYAGFSLVDAEGKLLHSSGYYASSLRAGTAGDAAVTFDASVINAYFSGDSLSSVTETVALATESAKALYWEGTSGGNWEDAVWSKVDEGTVLQPYINGGSAFFTGDTAASIQVTHAVKAGVVRVENGAYTFDLQSYGDLSIGNTRLAQNGTMSINGVGTLILSGTINVGDGSSFVNTVADVVLDRVNWSGDSSISAWTFSLSDGMVMAGGSYQLYNGTVSGLDSVVIDDTAYTVTNGKVDADVILSKNATYSMNQQGLTGDITVNNGVTVKVGASGGLGALNNAATSTRVIRVNSGGILDAAGIADQSYRITLNGGTFANSGGGISNGSKQCPHLILEADSFVSTTSRFGLLDSGYATSTLDLNDHTLTKKGTGTFHMLNTQVNSGTNGQGKIDVQEGTLHIITEGANYKDYANTLTIDVQREGRLQIEGRVNSTISSTLNLARTIIKNGGGTVNVNGTITVTDTRYLDKKFTGDTLGLSANDGADGYATYAGGAYVLIDVQAGAVNIDPSLKINGQAVTASEGDYVFGTVTRDSIYHVNTQDIVVGGEGATADTESATGFVIADGRKVTLNSAGLYTVVMDKSTFAVGADVTILERFDVKQGGALELLNGAKMNMKSTEATWWQGAVTVLEGAEAEMSWLNDIHLNHQSKNAKICLQKNSTLSIKGSSLQFWNTGASLELEEGSTLNWSGGYLERNSGDRGDGVLIKLGKNSTLNWNGTNFNWGHGDNSVEDVHETSVVNMNSGTLAFNLHDSETEAKVYKGKINFADGSTLRITDGKMEFSNDLTFDGNVTLDSRTSKGVTFSKSIGGDADTVVTLTRTDASALQTGIFSVANAFAGTWVVDGAWDVTAAHRQAFEDATVVMMHRASLLTLAAEDGVVELAALEGAAGTVTCGAEFNKQVLELATDGTSEYWGSFGAGVSVVMNGTGEQVLKSIDLPTRTQGENRSITVNTGTLTVIDGISGTGLDVTIAAGATLKTALSLTGGSLSLDASGGADGTSYASLGNNSLTLTQAPPAGTPSVGLNLQIAGTEITGDHLTLMTDIGSLLGAQAGEGGLLGTLNQYFSLGVVTDLSAVNGEALAADAAGSEAWAERLGRSELFYDGSSLYLELADNILSVSPIYWEPTDAAGDGNWSGKCWANSDIDPGFSNDPGYILSPWPEDKAAPSVVFSGDANAAETVDTAAVTVDTAAVVTQMTVENGKYTFTQGTAADGTTPVGSLKVEDTLLIGENGHAVLDMAVEAKTIKLTDSFSFITVNQQISITEGGGWNASNGGTITNGLTNDSVVLSNSSLGGVATKSGNTINGNGLKLVGGHFSIVDSTLTGQIDNSGCSGVQLGGTIVLDTRAMGALIEGHFISYYDQTGATPTGENNGYTKEEMHAKLFTDSKVQLADATDKPFKWEMIDALGNRLIAIVTPTDNTFTTYAISSGSAGTEYVAGDKTKAAVYDATKALFSERATALVLYGGNIVLQTGLDKSEGTKLTGGIRAEQDGTVTITNGVTLSRADVNPNGHIISLDGAGTYDVISGTALIGKDGSTGTVKLADAWTGTVKTGALTGTDIDVSALGNANSTVQATSISATKLTAGTVGSLVVDGVTSLTGAGSKVNGLTTKKLLTLGKGADLTASGALDLRGGVKYQSLDAATKITAGSLTNQQLNVVLDSAMLQSAADAHTDKTQPLATLMTLDTASQSALSINGGSNVLNVYAAKYDYALNWAPSASPDAPTGTDLQLTAQANPNYVKEKYAGGTPNGMAGAAIMDDAFANGRIGTTGDLAAILAGVDAGTVTDKDLAAVAGSSTATLGMALAGDVERQLRAIRNRTTTMGVNQCVVNEGMPYFNAWVNAEGNLGELDQDSTYAGYKLDSWGGTVGFDVDVNPSLTLGLAVTAMFGDMTVDGPDMLEGDLDTCYVSAFARYAARAWTHTFIGTVGTMDGSYERTVTHANGKYTTKGDTDGTAFGLMYEVSRTFAIDDDGDACWQPVFNVAYRHASVGGYKEEGKDAALKVDDQTLNTVTFGAGARLQAVVGENLYNRLSVLELRALAKLDAGDRSSEADVAFAGGGRSAKVESAELGAFGVELGAGLSIPMGDEDSGTLFFDVSAELRSGYSNVNGTVGYRINF